MIDEGRAADAADVGELRDPFRRLRRGRSIRAPLSGAISRIALSTSARDSGASASRWRRSPSMRIHGRESDVRNNADAPRAAAMRSSRSMPVVVRAAAGAWRHLDAHRARQRQDHAWLTGSVQPAARSKRPSSRRCRRRSFGATPRSVPTAPSGDRFRDRHRLRQSLAGHPASVPRLAPRLRCGAGSAIGGRERALDDRFWNRRDHWLFDGCGAARGSAIGVRNLRFGDSAQRFGAGLANSWDNAAIGDGFGSRLGTGASIDRRFGCRRLGTGATSAIGDGGASATSASATGDSRLGASATSATAAICMRAFIGDLTLRPTGYSVIGVGSRSRRLLASGDRFDRGAR